MKLNNPSAEVFIPDGTRASDALARTSHLGIGAHPDDLEILAIDGILRCVGSDDDWFTGVVVADGKGAPRSGPYADLGDEEMGRVRRSEQLRAAGMGGYGAQILLDHPSGVIKDGARSEVVDDLVEILKATRPAIIYTHNLADKHETHVALALRVIEAVRRLPAESAPRRFLGCEVWRDLDWMVDRERINLDVSGREALQAALIEVHDSQVAGGKRYDLAALGRRRANATFLESHATDDASLLTFAMDLMPLLEDPALEPAALVEGHLTRFVEDVRDRMRRLG